MIKIRTLYIVLPLTILMAVGCYLKDWTAGIALWAFLALVCVGRILLRAEGEERREGRAEKGITHRVRKKRGASIGKLPRSAAVSSVSRPCGAHRVNVFQRGGPAVLVRDEPPDRVRAAPRRAGVEIDPSVV